MLLQIHEPGETPMPHEDDRGLAVGIDLGTTNSVVAIARESKAEVLRDERGRALLPSVVAYTPEGPIVGHEARALLLDSPDGVVSSIKRLMGRGASDLKSLAGVLPYELGPAAEGGMARLVIGGRLLTPVEISAEILRAVRVRAEKALGQAVDRAVITVPAYFDDAARTATRDAARVAGLDVLRLVNEPTAAALAYGLDKDVEGLYAVFDLGGGTFDFSLLRLERGVFQVLATGGDTALGGDDIDHLIAERMLRERGVAKLDSGLVKQSLMTARLAKECLSTHARWDGVLDLGGAPSRHALTREEYDALIETLVERTIRISRQVLTDAGVTPAQLGGCVLVGGSTRIPLVRRRLEDFLGKAPLGDIDPDEVVAVGAALQAEALTVGSDTLLLDVTPLSLGLETMGGVVEKIIERNTPIPVAKAQEFTTYQDGQSAMAIHVVQGEREMVDQCRSLGRFVLDGIPPMVAGAARIRVAFAVDADGLLAVSARELTTGKESRIEVRPSYGLSDDEMAQMLRDSLDNAEEDMEARLLAETKVEARRTLNAVRSALAADGELLAPDERSAVVALAETVEHSLSGRDRTVVAAAAEALEQGTKLFAERRMDRGIRAALAGRSVDQLGI